MAVVEGHAVGAGDLTCSQCVSCWAHMGAGGRTSPWVDGCGGRAGRWCWGLNMQPMLVMLGVMGAGGRMSPWVDGCGGRTCPWWRGLIM